jgi:16S rRNA (adenine1518-N6/adenine1519-N6)-dimethyltransferase
MSRDREHDSAAITAAFGAAFDKPAKKSLGQHFLHERGVIEKMLLAISPKAGDRFVEIGPGQGALTFPLLERHGALTAIEFDRDLLEPLTAAAKAHGELTLINSDVMNVDFTELTRRLDPLSNSPLRGSNSISPARHVSVPARDASSENPLDARAAHPCAATSVIPFETRIRLVGNLPYNLSSPILFHALDHAASIRDMHFMLQKEVVDRMAAAPGSKVYGRLSVMLQAYCAVTSLFKVPPGAFRPPPKVDSAVVRLVPRPPQQIGIDDPRRFADVVRAAFGQRRKTLRNALGGVCTAEQIIAAGIDPQTRAEQLQVADFVRLANLAPARAPQDD